MKKLLTIILSVVAAMSAQAQFSDLMQFAQTQQSLSLFSYNGYVDVGYSAGVGYYKANKFEATTSHGVSNGRVFAGLGAGVDVLKTETVEHSTRWDADLEVSDNAYMVPLFLDFRYSGRSAISFFFDCKTGVAFLVGDDYITIGNGIIDNEFCFYLNCSIGLRFALGAKSAFNVGVSYGLIQQRYYDYDDYYYHNRYDGISLNSIGVTAGFEW